MICSDCVFYVLEKRKYFYCSEHIERLTCASMGPCLSDERCSCIRVTNHRIFEQSTHMNALRHERLCRSIRRARTAAAAAVDISSKLFRLLVLLLAVGVTKAKQMRDLEILFYIEWTQCSISIRLSIESYR